MASRSRIFSLAAERVMSEVVHTEMEKKVSMPTMSPGTGF
jgi:hypothetical protein